MAKLPNSAPTYTVTLDENEVYTLQILLGHVASDPECHSIYTKLEEAGAVDYISTEDFDKVKLFGYRNQDGQLTVTLDTVQVVEHVAYEQKGGNGGVVEDDVFGVSYQVKKAEDAVKADVEEAQGDGKPKQAHPPKVVEEDFGDAPF